MNGSNAMVTENNYSEQLINFINAYYPPTSPDALSVDFTHNDCLLVNMSEPCILQDYDSLSLHVKYYVTALCKIVERTLTKTSRLLTIQCLALNFYSM